MKLKFISEFLDFVIPRFCITCSITLATDEKFICNDCESKVKFLSNPQIEIELQRKFKSTSFVDDYTSLYLFEEGKSIQQLIHSLKYDNKFKIGFYLGRKLGEHKTEKLNSWKTDIIIPIPLFKLRRIDRGYNQSYYIAKGVSKETGIPTENRIVKRIKNTISQTTLDHNERKENVGGAFTLSNKKIVQSKKIIILDDVITTGATVSELAKLLKENGAAKVFAISVATPPISHSLGSTDT